MMGGGLVVETKKVTLWGKEIEVQKAHLIQVTNVFFFCHHCKKEVHYEWKREIIRIPNYFYMVYCPMCHGVEEIYL